MDKTVRYCCPVCHNHVDLYVEIYSHDEFNMDTNCPNCDAKISDEIIDQILNDEVTDFISSKIDYAREMMEDR